VLVTRKNGHKESDSEDDFPVRELPTGKRCTIVFHNGGSFQVIILEAHASYVVAEGGYQGRGLRIESDQVRDLNLYW